MRAIDTGTLDILLSRPERVTGFDVELLSRIRSRAGDGRTALVEVAGRDSLAAGVKAASSRSFDLLVPTIVYTGTEFGDWSVTLANAREMTERVSREFGVEVLDTIALGSPRWWHAAAGRFAGELFRIYGFPPTCLACHMYLHAARVPLALAVGAGSIVSGERLFHDGRRKLNQLEPALLAYRSVVSGAGIELLLPISDMREAERIGEILEPCWEESGSQMHCVLEGNYRDANGGITADTGNIERYLEEYLAPVTSRILSLLCASDGPPDYLAETTGAVKAIIKSRQP